MLFICVRCVQQSTVTAALVCSRLLNTVNTYTVDGLQRHCRIAVTSTDSTFEYQLCTLYVSLW